MAVAVHIVYLRPMPVDALGNVINKDDPAATIRTYARGGGTEPRVVPVDGLASSSGFPTISQYLIAEAAAGYVVRHMDNTMIVTYPAGS